jgi:hypothetical protein
MRTLSILAIVLGAMFVAAPIAPANADFSCRDKCVFEYRYCMKKNNASCGVDEAFCIRNREEKSKR